MRIYLTCFDGRLAEADLDSLESGQDKYSDLWAEGPTIVTELRLIVQESDGASCDRATREIAAIDCRPTNAQSIPARRVGLR